MLFLHKINNFEVKQKMCKALRIVSINSLFVNIKTEICAKTAQVVINNQ